uniref:Uncharacterized protein n=1 Tax=Branchiostoma floridae TaxID=7739 RepID=C3Y7A1_BRAFL|eukprot:XP_002607719.1 hypothetical protein BRAFLDRAFT_82834 [Branchiostoma floridae]
MDSDMMVTAGKNHLGFWTIKKITAGSSSKAFLTMKKGLFAEHQAKFVHCLDFGDNGDVITGDSKGSILVWKKGCNRISHANPAAHKGGIMAMRVTSEGTLVTGGGKDRRVVLWDRSYTRSLRECKLDKSLGGVRSICTADKCQMFSGNGLFLGTLSNALCHWTLDLETVESVSKGHADELWGLAAHPRKPQFVTCDYSGLVVLWESKTHRPVWRTQIKFAAQSAQFHPTEEILLIGTTAGRWYCIDASSAAIIEENQAGEDKKQLDCLRFSPDGAILAIGSHDNHIYMYNVENHGKSYKKTTRLSGHSSFVTHLDFSTDGRYMQSTSGDYELLYWDVAARSQLQFKSAMRDVTWNTQTCVFGFHVFGMWQQGADGHDILSCSASGSRALLASADTHGKVNLFRFPCSTFQIMQKKGSNMAEGLNLQPKTVGGRLFLDLSDQGLTSIPEEVFDITDLEFLIVSKNMLTSIPEGICRLRKLHHLEVEDNILTSLPRLEKLQKLKKLYISDNQFTELPQALCLLYNLEQLSVGNNPIKSLPDDVARLAKLNTLCISGCQFDEFPRQVLQLKALEELWAGGCKFDFVPDEVGNLPNMWLLSLECNFLKTLPSTMAHMNNLLVVHLLNNKFDAFPEVLCELPAMEKLDISNNNITKLPTALHQAGKLNDLDVSGNPLTYPPQDVREQGTGAIMAFLKQEAEKEGTKRDGQKENAASTADLSLAFSRLALKVKPAEWKHIARRLGFNNQEIKDVKKAESRVVTGTSPSGSTLTHAPPEYCADINLPPNTKFDVYRPGGRDVSERTNAELLESEPGGKTFIPR